jgi:hypothetical protein
VSRRHRGTGTSRARAHIVALVAAVGRALTPAVAAAPPFPPSSLWYAPLPDDVRIDGATGAITGDLAAQAACQRGFVTAHEAAIDPHVST